MKQLLAGLCVAILTTVCSAADGAGRDTTHAIITKTGRKILLDGFLMEWNTATVRAWDTTGGWTWDAMATPEGLAGYLRLQSAEICSTWNITIQSSVEKNVYHLRLPADSTSYTQRIRFDRSEFDSLGTVTAEWLLPYGKEVPNTSTPMEITFLPENGCDVSLPVLKLSYTPQPIKTGIKLTMIGQGLLILVLALLYFAVQRKIRLQTQRQKEYPHQ